MGKKMKLNLSDLKVQSFVTALNDGQERQIKGGRPLRSEAVNACGGWSWQYCSGEVCGSTADPDGC